MRGFFPISAACVKCPPLQDRSPSLDLRFREKRLAGEPLLRRQAQTLKSPPNRAFYRFSLRADFGLSRGVIWRCLMITVVGIFKRQDAAERVLRDLCILGIEPKRIDLLRPGISDARVSAVPTSDSEPSGMATTMGTLLGSAVGVAGGLSLGTSAASLMLPGVGPMLALGALGAVVLGMAGAVGGHEAGE